jgi:xanthine/uracil permease
MQFVWDAAHQIPAPVIGCIVIVTFLMLVFADAVQRPQADIARIDSPPIPLLAWRYVFGIIVILVILLIVYDLIIGIGAALAAQTALMQNPFS